MLLNLKSFVLLSLAAVIAMPAMADDETKQKRERPKRPGLVEMTLKRLEKASISDEQAAKIKAIATEHAEAIKGLREKAAPAKEQAEAVKAALKKAREDGQSKEEIRKVIAELRKESSPEQKAAQKELREANGEFHKAVMAVLTKEQLALVRPAKKQNPEAAKKRAEAAKKRAEAKKAGEAKKGERKKKQESSKEKKAAEDQQ